MENPAIEAWDLWKTYDGPNYVLRGVDLRVTPGETIVIWGPNGSGKTTLLNILGCLDQPTRGRLVVDARDVTALSESGRARVRRKLVGFVFQEPHLIEDLTVRENIALPLLIDGRSDKDARLRELLVGLELEDLAGKKPTELSGGQAQRASVARALANRPRVLLADEPTASLDPEASEMVLGLLAAAADEGVAVVIASHDPAVRKRISSPLRLKDGCLISS